MKTIPEGWVKIAKYDSRENKCVGGPSGDYARILQAIKSDPPLIRAYKDGKFWVANQADIDELLAPEQDDVECIPQGMLASPQQAKAAVVALCEINDGIALLRDMVERLAVAVEAVVTQPTPHDRLVTSVESNGFHN